jgi:chromate transporter
MNVSISKLFVTFFKLGLFTIGGGYAMIPFIERDIVERNGWIKREEFLDFLAVSQSAPGVFAVNMATFVGYRLRGSKGAFFSALGNILPSVLIILLIALFFNSFRENEVVNNIFKGLRPAVVALIAVPVFSVAKSAKITWATVWIPILSALLIVLFGVSPIYIILLAVVAGIVWGKIKG